MKTRSTTGLASISSLMKALADPVRLRLIGLLGHGGQVCVCHLHEALGLPQPTVSRHLASLRRAGLVVGRKDGLWVYYRLAEPKLGLHRDLCERLVEGLALLDDLDADRARLARLVPESTGPCC